MKVLFFFPPTGTSGDEYAEQMENTLSFEADTIRIYLRGCQQANIGNGLLYPNLDIAANHIYNAFTGTTLNIETLKTNLGDGISAIHTTGAESAMEVESIGLNGHSRGAMSTFAVAKKLDELEIPIDIVANQPVPGAVWGTSSSVRKYNDLSQCSNIRSATVFLATHSNHNAWWHNLFFKQLLPRFSPETTTHHFLLPVYEHFDLEILAILRSHTNNIFSSHGYTQFSQEHFRSIKKYYSNANTTHWWRSFIPINERQIIYGDKTPLSPDPIYLQLQSTRAMHYLNSRGVQLDRALEPDEVATIDYLVKTYDQPPQEYVTFLLEQNPKGQQFSRIINTVTETCRYVASLNINTHNSHVKANAINQASLTYQKTVFQLNYDFLNVDQPSLEQQAHFKSAIHDAEHQFRKDALGMEMGHGRRVMKFLTNFILHVTGIGMLANAIHKAQTGNWLFFNHNRSTTIIKEMRETLFDKPLLMGQTV